MNSDEIRKVAADYRALDITLSEGFIDMSWRGYDNPIWHDRVDYGGRTTRGSRGSIFVAV